MRTIVRAVIAPVVMAFALSGCWDRKELNDVAIVLAVGIDYAGDKYQVSVQAIDPSQTSKTPKGNRSPAILYTEEGPSVIEAVRKMTTKKSRINYSGHIRMILVSESTARQGITKALEAGFRLPYVRPDYYIAVVRGFTARDMLSLITPYELIPAMDLVKSLTVSEESWAPTSAVNALEFEKVLLSDSRQPVLTGLTIVGDFKKGQTENNIKQPKSFAEYQYTGLGVFKGDKLVGWLNASDSKTYGFIRNLVKSTAASAQCPGSGERFSIETQRAVTKLKPMLRDGKPAMTIAMHIDAKLVEMDCDMDLNKQSDVEKLEKLMRDKLQKVMETGIRRVQRRYGTDIYGFGEAFYRKYPKQWRAWSADWEAIFRELPIELDIRYRIKLLGKMKLQIRSNPLKEGRT